MTKDDIIRMAREAGLDPDLWNYTDAFERFAALVAAAEREACAELVWSTQQIKLWSEEELAATKLKEKNT